MSIKLKLEGFSELVDKIQKAGGSVDGAVKRAVTESAQIMQDTLKEEMGKAGVDGDLISKMPNFEVTQEANSTYAQVGYKKGAYNPDNLSDGYKVVFLNYGTPHRAKHGKVVARGFIKKAKSKAKPRIKKRQEETLKEILSEL